MSDRRDFFKKAGLLGLTAITAKLVSSEKLTALDDLAKHALPANAFTLPALPYAYDALEPFIDKQTMEIHYTKHHQAYVNKLNETSSTNIDYSSDDQTKCTHIDASTSMVIRNNLGGHVNHSLFWTMLKPNPTSAPNFPKTNLANAFVKEFKGFETFQKQFNEEATKHFGSGWCWLIVHDGRLVITTTPNQDNPLMKVTPLQGKIILGLDVWEHAYYLKYQNKRAEYINNWWNIVNWDKAEELYNS